MAVPKLATNAEEKKLIHLGSAEEMTEEAYEATRKLEVHSRFSKEAVKPLDTHRDGARKQEEYGHVR